MIICALKGGADVSGFFDKARQAGAVDGSTADLQEPRQPQTGAPAPRGSPAWVDRPPHMAQGVSFRVRWVPGVSLEIQ